MIKTSTQSHCAGRESLNGPILFELLRVARPPRPPMLVSKEMAAKTAGHQEASNCRGLAKGCQTDVRTKVGESNLTACGTKTWSKLLPSCAAPLHCLRVTKQNNNSFPSRLIHRGTALQRLDQSFSPRANVLRRLTRHLKRYQHSHLATRIRGSLGAVAHFLCCQGPLRTT